MIDARGWTVGRLERILFRQFAPEEPPWTLPTSICSTRSCLRKKFRTSGSPSCATKRPSSVIPSPAVQDSGCHALRRRRRSRPRRRHFSSEQSRGGVVALEDADAAADLSAQGRMMLTMDAPDHTRYRSLVNRGFTPRMIGALGTHIREMVTKILDPALEQRDCDFVADVAVRAAAAGDRGDAGGALRGSAQALRMEQPDDRQQGSRVRGQPGESSGGGDRDVHVLERAGEEAPRGSARRHRDRAAQGRPRRRPAIGDGLQRVLPAAGSRRQRDDAQCASRTGCMRSSTIPTQYATARGQSRDGAVGNGGDPALGVAGDVLPPQRNEDTVYADRKSRRATRSASGTSRRIATRTFSRTRSPSTSRGRPTSTSRSAAAARTSASAPAWREWR